MHVRLRLVGATVLLSALLFGTPLPAPGTDQGVLIRDTFDVATADWHALGPYGSVKVVKDAAAGGRGALEFSIFVGDKPGGAQPKPPAALPVDVIYRMTPHAEIAKMRSMSFTVRPDDDTALVVSLQEHLGGRYNAIAWLNKGVRQTVSLAPEDFRLSDDKNDPKDPDGKLDLDQVETITMMSFWSFVALSAGDSPQSVAMVSPHTGPHKLLFSDFAVLSEPPTRVPPTEAEAAGDVWIDDLGRETPGWLLLGDAQLHLDADAPWKGRALRLDYPQEQGKYIALIRDMHGCNLIHSDRLMFRVASAKSAKLYLILEEHDGAKYNAMVDVPGDSVPTTKTVSLGEFAIADDSPKDPDGKLDLDQLRSLTIVDVTGFLGLSKQQNRLWIGPIRARAVNL